MQWSPSGRASTKKTVAPWENIELTVRVENVERMTVEEVRTAAIQRAAVVAAAAADVLCGQASRQ
jgi:hypothetical protein